MKEGDLEKMQNLADKRPLWNLERSVIALFAVAVLGFGALVGYYYWERLAQPRTGIIERETQQLEARIRNDPQDPNARLGVASAYLQKGNYAEAINQYKQTLILREDDVMALLGLGIAYMNSGLPGEAIPILDRVVELNEGSEMAQIDKRLATAYFYLGKVYLDGNQPEDAAQYLSKARRIDSSNADYLYVSAQASQKLGNHGEAIELFSRALSFDPLFTEAYQELAVSHIAVGDFNKATYAEAMASLSSGNVDSAIGKLQTVASAAGNDADAFWGLGWAYERKGQKDAAVAAYGQALSINPKHMLARTSLGRIESTR